MDKQEWIDKAKARLVERGFENDQKTSGWAESIYGSALEANPDDIDDPESSVDEELTYF